MIKILYVYIKIRVQGKGEGRYRVAISVLHLGWDDLDLEQLESSSGWWAFTVATYCLAEHPKK